MIRVVSGVIRSAQVLVVGSGEALAVLDRLLGLANDVGLLAEEYDPVLRRQVGNFPQAFSHLGLVGLALALAR